MNWVFALLGILLITTGAIVVSAPYLAEPQMAEVPSAAEVPGVEKKSLERSFKPRGRNQTLFDQVREWSEKANAPLSILFGLISLFYTRRTYHLQRAR